MGDIFNPMKCQVELLRIIQNSKLSLNSEHEILMTLKKFRKEQRENMAQSLINLIQSSRTEEAIIEKLKALD